MRDMYYIFRREFYTVFRDHGVMVFFILLTLAYPVVYTYIYSNEVVRKVPVAVVNHAASPVSREFVRLWEASPNVEVVARCTDLEEARHLMHRKERALYEEIHYYPHASFPCVCRICGSQCFMDTRTS